MNRIIYSSVVCLTMLLIAMGCQTQELTKYSKTIKNCKSLKLGMNQARVRSIMGPPAEVLQDKFSKFSRKEEIVLAYPAPEGVETQPYLTFDVDSDELTQIICYEGYVVE